jgi:hypothetical protein
MRGLSTLKAKHIILNQDVDVRLGKINPIVYDTSVS